MKKLFLTDIDNTLIHSYKHAQSDDICIEYIHQKPQGFMTPCAKNNFEKICQEFEVVPITTRSAEQYNRIQWGKKPRYAIVANGGVLLIDGVVDKTWQQQTLKMIQPFKQELNYLLQYLLDTDLFLRVRMVDDTYVFAYCKDGVDGQQSAQQFAHLTKTNVVLQGKKIYFFPEGIDKGTASKKITKLLGYNEFFSAGDSVIDVPMLKLASIAYVPDENMATLVGKNAKTCDQKDFSVFLTKILKSY